MAMLTDIEIAQNCKMQPITEVAAKAGLSADDLELYGKYKAKLGRETWEKIQDKPDGKLVLVTAINQDHHDRRSGSGNGTARTECSHRTA